MAENYKDILSFWFEEIPSSNWWIKDSEFDLLITKKFGELHKLAAANKLSAWRNNAEGALAEIIILDQFSRNMFRDTPESFAYDLQAVKLTKESINKKFDQELDIKKRGFMYMPLMHSESLDDHMLAEKIFNQPRLEHMYEYEIKHKIIIERFGRYPHRNKILGRKSTPTELEFLKEPDSSF